MKKLEKKPWEEDIEGFYNENDDEHDDDDADDFCD